MKTIVLKNGVEIEISDRKSNRSGYTGATISVAWSLDPNRPFIACCGNPSDPLIRSQMRAQLRHCWQGGAYSDAREAAYVVGLFKQDMVGTDQYIANNGGITDFPADLYDLPVFLNVDDAKKLLQIDMENKKDNSSTPKKVPVKKTPKLSIEDVLGAVGRAIKENKSPKRNPQAIRAVVIDNFANFTSTDDAVNFVKDWLK